MKYVKHLKYLLLGGALLLFSEFALSFPVLTGRVVDEANIISASTKNLLVEKLAKLEATTTDQVVIVTLPQLEGDDIEKYGYQLGRHWGIGQKGKDNGALIIVSLKERAVRIEVGYGLEHKLTDAITSGIIRNQMVPYLKEGNYDQALLNATDDISNILSDNEVEAVKEPNWSNNIIFIILFFIVINFLQRLFGGRSRGIFFGGRGGGGGFSGGGGRFGGGGSSGKF